MATTFVKSKYGGMVPSDHPDADPNSGAVDPGQTTSDGSTGVSAAPAPPMAGATTQASAQAPAPVSTTPAPTGAPATVQDAFRQSLMTLLSGPSAAQVGADVGNSAPVAAFRNEQQRNVDMQRAGMAETSGLDGTQGSGSFDARAQGLQQAAGENTAAYAGQQTQAAMDARRQELQNAMQQAQAAGQFDQAQALSLKLAQMSNTTQNKQIDVTQQLGTESNANTRYNSEIQKMLGMSDLDLRKYLGDQQIALSRYGIDVGAGTAADQLGLGYDTLNSDDYFKWLDQQRLNNGGV